MTLLRALWCWLIHERIVFYVAVGDGPCYCPRCGAYR